MNDGTVIWSDMLLNLNDTGVLNTLNNQVSVMFEDININYKFNVSESSTNTLYTNFTHYLMVCGEKTYSNK